MLRQSAFALALVAVAAAAAVAAPQDHFFDSNGVKIHYVTEGQGEPVVLIHGFTASVPVQWQLPGIFSRLAKEYQVIAIDNRGHGKSDKPHDPAKYGPEMVGDVIRLLDHLKIDKAHIVGYSMGGFMTGYLISKHPERVISATLGGAGWEQAEDPRLTFIEDLAKSLETGEGIRPLIMQLNPPGAPAPSEEQISSINQMVMLMNDPKALAACIRGIRGLSVAKEKLEANQVPTLCIIGDKDPLKAGVDEMEKHMANLTVCVVPGADHMTAFTQPKFINDLKAHLAAHSLTKVPAAAGAGGK